MSRARSFSDPPVKVTASLTLLALPRSGLLRSVLSCDALSLITLRRLAPNRKRVKRKSRQIAAIFVSGFTFRRKALGDRDLRACT